MCSMQKPQPLNWLYTYTYNKKVQRLTVQLPKANGKSHRIVEITTK